ncbi:hypothetical protein PHJA_002500400 [Phtheirospermum japonicum]|uniref:S-protein homolog n=1 Tax=Phtheirospermum japonicum TaxID=374723 RepID=A0A830D8T5_9LAMI|nr:hypothetical protein PHJA_002500400 [Phtheirospermum japonicum]
MTNTMMKIILVIFVIFLNISQILVGACTSAFVTVYVVNNLPPNSLLNLHCQSKDDDLGDHTLAVNQVFNWSFYDDLGNKTLRVNENFHWTFCQNFFGRTLFFCHFYWGSKQRVFTVFKTNPFKGSYVTHYWLAKKDGFYFSNDNVTQTFTKKYDWS